jgi:hypothetical protein
MTSIFDDDRSTRVKDRDRSQNANDDLLGNTQLVRSSQQQSYADYLELANRMGPRNPVDMCEEAERIGELLGKAGFYSWPQGGSRVEGPTIDLAYALAQAWGRCITRCVITDNAGVNRVHMRGVYIDLQTMAVTERDYVAYVAPPPGKYAKDPDQAERWRIMQEQAGISKAVRGAILGGLPAWYVEAGFNAARRAAAEAATGGKTLAEARRDVLEVFGQGQPGKNGGTIGGFKLTKEELVAWVGQPVEMWTTAELGQFRELFTALREGRESVEGVRAAAAANAAEPTDAGKGNGGGRLDSLGLGKGEPKSEPKASGKGAEERTPRSRNAGKAEQPKSDQAQPPAAQQGQGQQSSPTPTDSSDDGKVDRALVAVIEDAEAGTTLEHINATRKILQMPPTITVEQIATKPEGAQRYVDLLRDGPKA